MAKLLGKMTVSLALAALAAGCGNSGSRSGAPVYGPGSTGHLGAGQSASGVAPGGGSGGTRVGSFSSAPALSAPRSQHTATTLADGRVLVTGGSDGQGTYQSSEVFDPMANAWTAVQGGMTVNGFDSARQLHTATLMGNGKVLLAGGLGVDTQGGQFGTLSSCVVFDPTTDTFTATGAMPQVRGWHVAARLANGHVLVAGGVDAALNTLTSSATYDPASGQWAAAGASSTHTWGAMVTAGQATVIVGGADVTYNANAPQGTSPWSFVGLPTPVAELFDAQGRTFGQAPPSIGDRVFYAGAANSAGQALFAGGLGLQGQNLVPTDTTEIFDGTAFTAGPVMSGTRYSPEIAEIGTTGDMLITGGIDGNNATTAVCEVVLVGSNTLAGQVSMAEARIDHKAVTLNDGRILVVGGADDNGNSLDTCEFYTR